MKRMLSIFICVCLMFGLCACQRTGSAQSSQPKDGQTLPLPATDPVQPDSAPAGQSPLAPTQAAADSMAPPTVLIPAEYVLYTNIFYNETGDDYVGQTFTKTGTLAKLVDAFNGCVRWYVWGYNDQTKCCDWQWEIVPKDADALPEIGSLVDVSGTFAKSEDALDGYWIEDAEISVKTPYTAPKVDNVLTVMSDTLERVQIYNMQYYPDTFENKSVTAYGRIAGPGELEDPYYDGSWTQKFSSSDELPTIGTIVILRGTYRNGVIDQCTITPTDEY